MSNNYFENEKNLLFPLKEIKQKYKNIIEHIFEDIDEVIDLNPINCEYIEFTNGIKYNIIWNGTLNDNTYVNFINDNKIYLNGFDKYNLGFIIGNEERKYSKGDLYDLDIKKRLCYEYHKYNNELKMYVKKKYNEKMIEDNFKKIKDFMIITDRDIDNNNYIDDLLYGIKNREKTLIYINILEFPYRDDKTKEIENILMNDLVKLNKELDNECKYRVLIILNYNIIYKDYFNKHIIYTDNKSIIIVSNHKKTKKDINEKGIII